jgi:DNA-binding NarL/FixJ family response regulator
MPGMSGIEACRQIVNSVAGCKVIMLTAYAEEELLFAAIQAGAAGYVLKIVSSNELVHAVERVSSGEGFLDSAMTATVFHELHQAGKTRDATAFSALTSQEVAVLTLVTRGMTNRQIAIQLYLGEGTIRNYVSSMLAKLAVANRAEAAAFAVKHSID